jgi:choline dehydrogenase-like flavoprotein
MNPVVIVGSGPSGVHFALSLLGKGYAVMMIDVGYEKPRPVNPHDGFTELKEKLSDPVAYLLGENFEGVVLPDAKKEYYAIPPNKEYVLRSPAGFAYQARGFAPLFSFAAGGLAEVWTGGCYPFNDAELADFPFRYADIQPYYAEVARRIGITGARDDLSRFFPFHDHLLEPLELDPHSALLVSEYEKQRSYFNHRLRCFLGRTRVATLSEDRGPRKKCDSLGRCLWGCPTDSFYTPSITLAECKQYPNFTYLPGLRVTHFKFTAGNRITSVVAESFDKKHRHEFPVDRLVLAAGALCSSKIFLDSIYQNAGEMIRLPGLMDNRQALVPFLNLRLMGQSYNPRSYQYHQLGIGIESNDPKEYVHGLITTLKTAMIHPIAENLPCDLQTAAFLVRNLHCGLGIINVNLHDTRREENHLTLELKKGSGETNLVIRYSPAVDQATSLRKTLATIKKALWRLGCIVPPRMVHIRPMGASAHYAGTLPMSVEKKPCRTSPWCQSYDFENLYIADGATFPFLPAKNITFTLMANAVRVAETAF